MRAITLNHETFRGFTFSTNIVKKKGRSLILDGVHSWGYLSDQNPQEMVKLMPHTDLRQVEAEFIRDFRRTA